MEVDFPQIDYITHASADKLSYLQQEYIRLMNLCNHYVNQTFHSLLDRISNTYNYESIIRVLKIAKKVIDEEKQQCEERILFDDFVLISSQVEQALRSIIYSPSKKLTKVTKDLPANKVKKLDAKTMMWLSRRPGLTIEEKIAPRYVIPSKVTYFSLDTMENRHTMYLFDILYDYLFEKVYPMAKEKEKDKTEQCDPTEKEEKNCEQCDQTEKECYKLFRKLQSILLLKHRILTGEMREVAKQKQFKQNNKLMADKEYKQIWDAVKKIDYYEQTCKAIWDHLEQRYLFMAFIYICANISSTQGIKTFEEIVEIIDKEGELYFVDEEGNRNSVTFFDEEKNEKLIVSLKENKIVVSTTSFEEMTLQASFAIKEKGLRDFPLLDIQKEFKKIKEKEEEKNVIMDEITQLKEEKSEKEDALKQIKERKELLTYLLVTILSIQKEEMKENEEGIKN